MAFERHVSTNFDSRGSMMSTILPWTDSTNTSCRGACSTGLSILVTVRHLATEPENRVKCFQKTTHSIQNRRKKSRLGFLLFTTPILIFENTDGVLPSSRVLDVKQPRPVVKPHVRLDGWKAFSWLFGWTQKKNEAFLIFKFQHFFATFFHCFYVTIFIDFYFLFFFYVQPEYSNARSPSGGPV